MSVEEAALAARWCDIKESLWNYFSLSNMNSSFLQHANGENAWTGIDGNTGEITDMKERKV